ncbi:MAG: hypothetical protein E7496_08160 [Ruminococcus sp.]|nr:hypothetical protein [Ruminococcus sp.]
MNTRKEFCRKAVAFISALSFITASNYGTMSALSIDSLTENPSVVVINDSSDTSSDAEEELPDDAPSDEKESVQGTTEDDDPSVEPDLPEEPAPTITMEIRMNFETFQDTEKILQTSSEKIKALLGNPSADISYDESSSSILIEYPSSDTPEKEAIEALAGQKFGISFDEESYFLVTIGDNCTFANVQTYYSINDESNICDLNSESSTYISNVISANGKNYIHYGTTLNTDLFLLSDGYRFVESEFHNADGAVTIQQDKITVTTGEKRKREIEIFSIEKTKLKLTFYFSDASVKNNDNTVYNGVALELNWLDIGSEQIEIHTENPDKFSINGSIFTGYSGTAEDLLTRLNLLREDILYIDGYSVPLSIMELPDSVNAIRYFGDQTQGETVTYTVDGSTISDIPLIVKKNGVDYYLESVTTENGSSKYEGDFSKAWANGYYYASNIYYSRDLKNSTLQVHYQKAPYSGLNVNENELNAKILSSDEIKGKRNDNVYTVKSSPIISIKMTGISNVDDFAELKIFDEIFHSQMNTFTKESTDPENPDADFEYTWQIRQSTSTFLKVLCLVNEMRETIRFNIPFYFYADTTAPEITEVSSDYKDKENPDGWSSEHTLSGNGQYRFTFTVNDDMPAGTGARSDTAEYQEALSVINDNQNLNSVKEITIGELTFNRPENGWQAGRAVSPALMEDGSVPDTDYNIVLTPITGEDGTFTGTFNAVLTLRDKDADAYHDTLFIHAKDDCDNQTSKPKSVEVKIDTRAPQVSSISIEGLEKGLFSEMVLQYDKDFKVKADYSDEPSLFKGNSTEKSSGIRTVTYEYADETSEDGTFDSRNTRDLVKITLEDNAGNKTSFYYASEESNYVTDSISDATYIVTDTLPPAPPVLSVRDSDYTDSEDRNWYSDYPEIQFSAEDNNDIKSEIKNISLKINNTETVLLTQEMRQEFQMTEKEMVNLLSSGKMRLIFEPEKTDNQKFCAYICNVENPEVKIPVVPASDSALSLDEGRLTVSMNTTDFAGNVSDSSKIMTVYIDNNHPVIKGTFSSDEMAMRKFGSFANHVVTVSVPVSDTVSNISDYLEVPSSGYQEAVLNFAGKSYQAIGIENRDGTDYAVFAVPDELLEDTAVSGEFSVVVKDNVNLVSEPQTGKILSSDKEGKSDVIIENKPPVLTDAKITGENHYQNETGENWYSSDITVEYQVTDTDSGVAEVGYTVKHDDSNTETASKNDNFTEAPEKTTEQPYSLRTDETLDGKFLFSIQTTDNAGNVKDDETEVYKDINAPYISGFSFDDANKYADNLNITGTPAERFSHFYDDGTVMTITAKDDRGASSGINTIFCVLYNTDGSVFLEYAATDFTIEGDIYSSTFLLPEGFKGDIRAWVTDNVQNRSEERSPDGYAAENEQRNLETSSLSIELPSTSASDPDGLPLYNKDVTAVLTVEDTFSGIRKIEWSTSDFEGWNSITVDADGNISGNSDGWYVDAIERNIALRITREITVSNDANGDFIRLRVTDNSGNVTIAEETFSIDKHIPVISVTGIQASKEKKYYNSAQKATVTITERNFAAPTVNEKTDNDFKEDPSSRAGTDDYRHLKEFAFDKDGTYHLNVEANDLAGNKADSYASGEFVIDTEKPAAVIEFRRQDGTIVDPDKTFYINQPVKAVISVTETNFSGGDISIRINDETYTPEKWTDSQETHTAEIPLENFKENQEYTVRVTGKDLAGNSLKEEIKKNFVIDDIAPELNASGFQSANKGSISPTIEITDKNIDTREVTLTRNGKICKSVFDSEKQEYQFTVSEDGDYVTGHWTTITMNSGMTEKFVLDNFPEEKCYDGFYHLEYICTDKAGNTSSDFSEFSVNRFGSAFFVNDMGKINGSYLNKPPTVVITEQNVDKHSELSGTKNSQDANVIIIMDKGTATVQFTEDMYTVSEPKKLKDNSGYEYTYTISPENFDEDADYNLSIQTVDAAGNENVSSARNAEVEFTLDTHEPSYKCDNLTDDSEYKEAEKSFRLNASEELQHIIITTNLKEVLLEETFSDKKEDGTKEKSYVFTIPAARAARYITVEITDFAANKTIQKIENLLVTDDTLSYLWHKKWFKSALGAVGAAGILGGGAYFIIRKRRED